MLDYTPFFQSHKGQITAEVRMRRRAYHPPELNRLAVAHVLVERPFKLRCFIHA